MGDAPIEIKWDIAKLEKLMEEMAGAPSVHHERQPGERCMYEIQRKENVTNRNGTEQPTVG